jgi:hypothetical protein
MLRGLIYLLAVLVQFSAIAECDFETDSLNRYEDEILRAAEKNELKKMVPPLVCILKMQQDSEGFSRYLSSSFLRPMFGGGQTPGTQSDPRYQVVAKVLEQLAMRPADVIERSVVAEFSKGDWNFYTLFCEKGNTEYCSIFLPDEKRVKSEAPLLAAASMMRLRKAYQVLNGQQRDLIAARIKKLHHDIPHSDALKRKFIDQIYDELFVNPLHPAMLG